MVRRTKEDAEETRNLILDAAETVFNDKGVARTSLAEIATAAGVTRGAIYWHFKNKADLFHAMLERVEMPIDEMIEQLETENSDDALSFVHRAAVSVLHQVATDAQTRRVFGIVSHKCEMVDEMAVARDRRKESCADCLSHIELALQAAVEQKQLPPSVNVRRAAVGLHALVDGLISNWVLHPENFDLEKESNSLIKTYVDGLRYSLN